MNISPSNIPDEIIKVQDQLQLPAHDFILVTQVPQFLDSEVIASPGDTVEMMLDPTGKSSWDGYIRSSFAKDPREKSLKTKRSMSYSTLPLMEYRHLDQLEDLSLSQWTDYKMQYRTWSLDFLTTFNLPEGLVFNILPDQSSSIKADDSTWSFIGALGDEQIVEPDAAHTYNVVAICTPGKGPIGSIRIEAGQVIEELRDPITHDVYLKIGTCPQLKEDPHAVRKHQASHEQMIVVSNEGISHMIQDGYTLEQVQFQYFRGVAKVSDGRVTPQGNWFTIAPNVNSSVAADGSIWLRTLAPNNN